MKGLYPLDMPCPDHNFRQYGTAPSTVVVLHGGPGGAGEVQPFASALGQRGYNVLEPFQTKSSIDGQIAELRQQIEQYASPPVTLIGWSWGAWLACLLAAQYPDLPRKLMLVGSGPLLPEYASCIRETKAARLSPAIKAELATLASWDNDPAQAARFIEINDIADTFERDASPAPKVTFDKAIHTTVWAEALAMRECGALLEQVRKVHCPVLAIHGDHDPRPAQGVSEPLAQLLPKARFELLERCGHKPWQEVHAKSAFYRLIESELL